MTTSDRRHDTNTLPLPLHDMPDASQIRERMMSLPFADLTRAVARLLEKIGYRDVRLMGTPYGKGRNVHGGLDIRALLPSDLTQAAAIAQVKQYREPVPRSFVDELRGAMVRLGAQQGLLVTTSSFAPAAMDAATAGQGSLPVRLIDGAELAALMTLHGVQVGPDAPAIPNKTGPRAISMPALPPGRLDQPVTVIVTVRPGRPGGGRGGR